MGSFYCLIKPEDQQKLAEQGIQVVGSGSRIDPFFFSPSQVIDLSEAFGGEAQWAKPGNTFYFVTPTGKRREDIPDVVNLIIKEPESSRCIVYLEGDEIETVLSGAPIKETGLARQHLEILVRPFVQPLRALALEGA